MHLSTLLLRCAPLRRRTSTLLINDNVSIRKNSSDSSSTIPSQSESFTPNASKTNWTTIYKFPYISTIVRLNRVKVYQAAFTSIGVPVCMALESTEILSSGTAQIFAVLGITGTIALSLASLTVGRNVVGFAYVDQLNNPRTLRLSCPDFWGRRRNIELPVDDIVPQLDLSKMPFDLYIRVKCSPDALVAKQMDGKRSPLTQTYKLVHRHGEIVQTAAFSYVFGEC